MEAPFVTRCFQVASPSLSRTRPMAVPVADRRVLRVCSLSSGCESLATSIRSSFVSASHRVPGKGWCRGEAPARVAAVSAYRMAPSRRSVKSS
ncbi:hypothetical protein D3C87_1522070 [compost metagenome]